MSLGVMEIVVVDEVDEVGTGVGVGETVSTEVVSLVLSDPDKCVDAKDDESSVVVVAVGVKVVVVVIVVVVDEDDNDVVVVDVVVVDVVAAADVST